MKILIGIGSLFLIVVVAFVGVFIFLKTQSPKEFKDNISEDVKPSIIDEQTNPTSIETPEIEPTKEENKLCDWVDKSDIIIKVNFAEGVEKDTSYETGFYFDSITSSMRLARKGCDYRTGFSFAEHKGAGLAEVGVRGYTDNKRRSILGEPISLSFDENGVPSIGNYIEVTITN